MSPFCANCGSTIEENWNTCPNCGSNINSHNSGESVQQTPSPQQTSQPPTQTQQGTSTQMPASYGYGIASLILAVIGCVCFSYILGPLAIVLGAIGISKDTS